MNSSKDKKLVLGMLITFAVLAVLYASQYVYSKSTGKVEFEYALRYTQEEKLNVKGFAVRDENRKKDGKNISVLLKDSSKVYVPVLTDSANVGKNDVIAITFVLLYAARVKGNPQKSIMYEADAHWRNHISEQGAGVEYYRNRASWVSFAIAAAVVVCKGRHIQPRKLAEACNVPRCSLVAAAGGQARMNVQIVIYGDHPSLQ